MQQVIYLCGRLRLYFNLYKKMPKVTKAKRGAAKKKDEKTDLGVEDKNDKGDAKDSAHMITEYPIIDSVNGKKFNFKVISWNVAGLRAWCKKGAHDWLLSEDADVICLQETKCSKDQVPNDFNDKFESYKQYWHIGSQPGYSGTALISKQEPMDVTYGIGKEEHDGEGRTITAEYENFFVVNTYVPNSKRKLARLEYRQKFDTDFREYIKSLDEKKPVILAGDLNVAHQEIDLKNPKTNKRNAGFTIEERDGLTSLLKENFIDSFRHLYPDREDAYTFWTNMMNARSRNVGWRLDYFILSDKLKEGLCDNIMNSTIMGSDHCPISLLLSM